MYTCNERGDIVKAIYACKLYKASNRKSKIEAALADPLNLELVTQLKSYLDSEYQDIIDNHEAKQKAELVDNLTDGDGNADEGLPTEDSSDSSASSTGGFGGSLGPKPSLSEKFDMLVSGDDSEEGSDDIPADDNSSELDSDILDDSALEDIEETTAIEGVEDTLDENDPLNLVSEVRELLNCDESTQGINRVLVKKNELWVHYNDDINLNNVMGPVIEKLSAAGYNYMDFNRLARSENAIVFQINQVSPSPIDREGIDGN